jgi:hypothetical protein
MTTGLAASSVTAATNAPALRSSATVLWPVAWKFGDNQGRMCGMSDIQKNIGRNVPDYSLTTPPAPPSQGGESDLHSAKSFDMICFRQSRSQSDSHLAAANCLPTLVGGPGLVATKSIKIGVAI